MKHKEHLALIQPEARNDPWGRPRSSLAAHARFAASLETVEADLFFFSAAGMGGATYGHA